MLLPFGQIVLEKWRRKGRCEVLERVPADLRKDVGELDAIN